MTDKGKLRYGERILVTALYKRKFRYGLQAAGVEAYWETYTHRAGGIYLGQRTLANGTVSHASDGHNFKATEYLRVALVSIGPSRNPVYVPFTAIIRVED